LNCVEFSSNHRVITHANSFTLDLNLRLLLEGVSSSFILLHFDEELIYIYINFTSIFELSINCITLERELCFETIGICNIHMRNTYEKHTRETNKIMSKSVFESFIVISCKIGGFLLRKSKKEDLS